VNIDAGGIAFVRVLGPIQVVTTSGRALDLPSASQRRLLARLAVDAPQALRADLLCDVLAVSPGALRTIVSRLRRGFGGTTVVALIAARRWAEAIAELKAHVSVNPLRDRAWGLLVQALGGAGRQADAWPRSASTTPISRSGSGPNHQPRCAASSGRSPPAGMG
jgi:DNA-binding SARP family transcriptional activator